MIDRVGRLMGAMHEWIGSWPVWQDRRSRRRFWVGLWTLLSVLSLAVVVAGMTFHAEMAASEMDRELKRMAWLCLFTVGPFAWLAVMAFVLGCFPEPEPSLMRPHVRLDMRSIGIPAVNVSRVENQEAVAHGLFEGITRSSDERFERFGSKALYLELVNGSPALAREMARVLDAREVAGDAAVRSWSVVVRWRLPWVRLPWVRWWHGADAAAIRAREQHLEWKGLPLAVLWPALPVLVWYSGAWVAGMLVFEVLLWVRRGGGLELPPQFPGVSWAALTGVGAGSIIGLAVLALMRRRWERQLAEWEAAAALAEPVGRMRVEGAPEPAPVPGVGGTDDLGRAASAANTAAEPAAGELPPEVAAAVDAASRR